MSEDSIDKPTTAAVSAIVVCHQRPVCSARWLSADQAHAAPSVQHHSGTASMELGVLGNVGWLNESEDLLLHIHEDGEKMIDDVGIRLGFCVQPNCRRLAHTVC